MKNQGANNLMRLGLMTSGILLSGANGANLLINPGFEYGNTYGWSPFGGVNLSISQLSHTGNYSVLITDRTATWNGIRQTLLGLIDDNDTCAISGWVRIDNTPEATVKLTIKQSDGSGIHYHMVDSTTAYNDRWVKLSGFFTLEVTGELSDLFLYFEGPSSGVNFYVDDGYFEIIDSGDWEVEANQRIEQIRKGDFNIKVVSPNNPNVPLSGVTVQINQTRHHFAFGSAINHNISDANYAQFFKDHFEWAVMENESKWYANEPYEDYVTYEAADEIYDFCNANNIRMRGHCIFWAAENMVQDWVKTLSYAPLPEPSELRTAVEDRLDSVVNHFKGKFLHWDVNNEMCNNSFFADRLGPAIRVWMFQAANAIDPNCMLFLNDYNVINNGYNLEVYKQLAYDLQSQGAPIHGLGVQCHMTTGFNPATIKARFDSVAEVNLPIWVTEFDVSQPDPNIRADELEKFYRVAFSHPAVQGILMWGFWEGSQWREDCHLVNQAWTLNEAGLRYEALMDEWTTSDSAVTDSNGTVSFRGFYGTYDVNLVLSPAEPTVATIEVVPDGPNEFIIALQDMPEPQTCQQVQQYGYNIAGDLDSDCHISYSDFAILANQWLSSDPVQIPPYHSPDIHSNGMVDIVDLSILIENWLICNDPENPDCIANW